MNRLLLLLILLLLTIYLKSMFKKHEKRLLEQKSISYFQIMMCE